jgi:DNA repair ATPase RecN
MRQPILELARQAQDLSKVKQSAQNAKSELEDLKKTSDVLSALLVSVGKLCESLAVLRSVGVLTQNLSNEVLLFVRELEESEREFEDNPNQVDKLERLKPKLLPLQKKTHELWQKFVSQELEQYQNVCEVIKALKLDSWQDVKRTQDEISPLKGKQEFTQEDLNKVRQALARLNAITKKVNLPEAMREFFQKVIKGIATLEDLDLHKIQWLEGEGLLGKLKVSVNHDGPR